MASEDAFDVISKRTNRTDELTLCLTNPRSSESTKLSSFRIQGVEYVRKKEVASGGNKRAGVSKVWQYSEVVVWKKDGAEFFYCYQCEVSKKQQRLLRLQGTSNARRHIEDAHKLDVESGEVKEKAKNVQNEMYTFVYISQYDRFKHLLIRWFVFCQLALFMLENTFFREVVTYLNAGLGALLPKASSMLRRWIIAEFEEQKKLVVAEISKSVSKVHLSFDIWTAGSWIGFISVYSYWIDRLGRRQPRLLAFRRIYSSHDGENQADILQIGSGPFGSSKAFVPTTT